MGQYFRKLIFRTDSQKVKALVQHVSLISRKLMVNGKPFTGTFIFYGAGSELEMNTKFQ